MSSLFSIQSYQLKSIYHSLSVTKIKDKLDMILEPLQSMIQIAILSVSPVGTKLCIYENILYIQNPSFIQPISRWYNADKKDDLYFLFQVIKRFVKWYNPKVSKKTPVTPELYNLIIEMSLAGLDNLLKTYDSNQNNAFLQVIYMYKNLLESTELLDLDKHCDKSINIDELFESITSLYSNELINIIYYTLLTIKQEDDIVTINNLINGLSLMMDKNNRQIQTWIKQNLII